VKLHVPSEEIPRKRRSLFAVAVATALMSAVLYYLHSISLWITTGVTGGVILILGLWAEGRRILPRLAPGLGGGPKRRFAASLGLGLATGVVMILATHLGFELLAAPFPALVPLVEILYAEIQAPPGPVLALPIVALVVLAEEVMWRAVLMDALRPRIGAAAALAASVGVYSLPQVIAGNWPLLAAAVGGGALWGALYLLRRDLVAPFACHLLWDLGVFVVWPLT
jgi:membrane protease YdiL (CAAX protease family)